MKVQLPIDLYNAVLTALAERPYKEVAHLMMAMDRERIVVSDPAPSEDKPE